MLEKAAAFIKANISTNMSGITVEFFVIALIFRRLLLLCSDNNDTTANIKMLACNASQSSKTKILFPFYLVHTNPIKEKFSVAVIRR